MTERRDPERDGLESALQAWMASVDEQTAGPCPDANELAAFATAALLEAERTRLQAHLAACGTCRSALAAAVRTIEAPAPAATLRPRRRKVLALGLATAAALVLGVLAAFWLDRQAPVTSTEEALGRQLAELKAAHPDLFGAVTLLSREERLQRGDVIRRGGTGLQSPIGRVLTQRPRFVWRSVHAATLSVSTQTGQGLVRVEGISSPWPWPLDSTPLQRGRTYLAELDLPGVLGREVVRGTFEVAPKEVAERYEAQATAVQGSTPLSLRSLLLAHLALRHGLLEEARGHAEAYAAANPEDAVGRETLFHILTRSGDPRAADVLEAD